MTNLDTKKLKANLEAGMEYEEAVKDATVVRGTGGKPDLGPIMSGLTTLTEELNSPEAVEEVCTVLKKHWPHEGFQPDFTAKETEKTGHYAEWKAVEGDPSEEALLKEMVAYFMDRQEYLKAHPDLRGQATKLEKAEKGLSNTNE